VAVRVAAAVVAVGVAVGVAAAVVAVGVAAAVVAVIAFFGKFFWEVGVSDVADFTKNPRATRSDCTGTCGNIFALPMFVGTMSVGTMSVGKKLVLSLI